MNKPKFDPSKPFDVADKPVFDPNKPFDIAEESPKSVDSSKAESFLQGFGQAGTLGYLPNIQAAVEPYTDKIVS